MMCAIFPVFQDITGELRIKLNALKLQYRDQTNTVAEKKFLWLAL